MSHHIKRSRGSKTCLILIAFTPARGYYLVTLLGKGRRCPTIVVELGREQVVECQSHRDILYAQLGQLEVIAQVDIRREMPVQHHAHIYELTIVIMCLIALKACVRHVLLTDILALNACFQPTIVESEDIVQDEVGRECQWLVTQVGHTAIHQLYGNTLDTVLRPSGIDIPTEPVYRLQGCLQFHTQTIAVGHVTRNGLTYLVYLTCQDKLVLIVHPVEVGSCCKELTLVLVAHLQIVQSFSLGLV